MSFLSRALCRATESHLFAPEANSRQVRTAVGICADCPVRTECLRYAVEHTEVAGVWGGTTMRQRESLRESLRSRR